MARRRCLVASAFVSVTLAGCTDGETIGSRVAGDSPDWVGRVESNRLTVVFGPLWRCTIHDQRGRRCRVQATFDEGARQTTFKEKSERTERPVCRLR
jgi:hypothetical protein